ncbi:transcription termination/antitermination protein NusA [Candidatus Saccharibacteria bacterium]|nr:transcription termination/antitermination protein NusA [Candidatus Saccharibacteria bacterium]
MDFDIKQLAQAMKIIAEEKNLPEDLVQEIVETALASAYKRDYGNRDQEVRVAVNLNTGAVDVYIQREVVESVEDENTQISLAEAKKNKKDAKIGDIVEQFVEVKTFGRVAAQTAKQVIMQRLRDSEREVVIAEYEDKVGQLVNGIVSRVENRLVRVEVGKAQAIMPASEQSSAERYFPGQRLKLYLKEIEKGFRGPQLIVSRGSSELVKQLFFAEVPEMESGAVEMKAIAREAGVRTKLAVHSTVQGVDPVGTFVGGHGTRVNAVVSEIGDQEKIDIVVWDDNPEVFIASALSPTKVKSVVIDEASKRAKVVVNEDQLSVAIGKGGQNVRLASKLTGYEIDINAVKGANDEVKSEAPAPLTVDKVQKPKLKRKSDLENSLLSAIDEHGE